MMKRSTVPMIALATLWLVGVGGGATVLAADGQSRQQLQIEAMFVEHLPDGRLDVLASPKVCVLAGKLATLRCGEERTFPIGGLPEEAEEVPHDTVFEGTTLEVTAKLLDGVVFLVGHGTITDVLDVVNTNPPNEGEAVSYALRSVVTPLSLLLIPGDDYVVCPSAKRGDRKIEIRLRAKLVEPDSKGYRGTIAARCLKGDQYLVEIRIVRDLPGGQTAIVAVPQIVVVGEAEGKISIGRRTKDGAGYEPAGLEVFARVKEIDGKKVATAEATHYEHGAIAWQMDLQAPVVAADQAAGEAKEEP